MTCTVNGEQREVPGLPPQPNLAALLGALDLKVDRIAVELNGDIVRRAAWDATPVRSGDRLEVVHFVGGGSR